MAGPRRANVKKYCYYCLCALVDPKRQTRKNPVQHCNARTRDHLVPRGIERRGRGCLWVWACYQCNNLKNNMSEAEFRALAKQSGGFKTEVFTQACRAYLSKRDRRCKGACESIHLMQ